PPQPPHSFPTRRSSDLTNFFTPKTAYEYSQANTQNFTGQKTFLAPNPPYGAELVYRLTSGASRDSAKIVVTNIRGDTVRTLTGRSEEHTSELQSLRHLV